MEKERRGRHSQLSGDGRPVGRPVAGAVEGRVPKFRIRSCTFLIDAAEPANTTCPSTNGLIDQI